jgi:hypothetical protein
MVMTALGTLHRLPPAAETHQQKEATLTRQGSLLPIASQRTHSCSVATV